MDDEIFALILQLSIDDTYGLSFGTSDLDIGARLQREKMQDYLSKKGGQQGSQQRQVFGNYLGRFDSVQDSTLEVVNVRRALHGTT
jgi:hypothetical protein